MAITKDKLAEVLLDLDKDDLKAILENKGISKSGTKEDLVKKIVGAATKIEIETILSSKIEELKFEQGFLESDNNIILPGNFETILCGITNILGVKKINNNHYVGFVKVIFDTLAIAEDTRVFAPLINPNDLVKLDMYSPFELKVSGKVLSFRVASILSSKYYRFLDDTNAYIHTSNFDIALMINKIQAGLLTANIVLARTDFTLAIRKLVRNKKINAVRVDCDDSQNFGVNSRKLHRASSKKFIEDEWYVTSEFYSSSKVYPTTWYYYDGDYDKTPESCERVKIDCINGIITKTRVSSSIDWLINEIVAQNF